MGIEYPGICSGIPEEEVTEKAAIGMMALLLVDRERLVVEKISRIGTGADYEVSGVCEGERFRIEVSGVSEARYPSKSSGRLEVKRKQLLRVNARGFVSVTTFSYPPDERVHSYLHFVFRQTDAAEATQETTVDSSRDSESEASALALEAETALYRADTVTAREKHTQAGEILKRRIDSTRTSGDRHFYRFLAATQYYHAGLYNRALKLVCRIEARLLPERVRHLFPDFRREVRRRAKPTYVQSIRARFVEKQQRNEYRQIAALLWNHPYIYDRKGMAFLRAYVSFQLREYAAAGVFAAAARQFGLDSPARVMELASLPFAVAHRQGFEAGWEAARRYAKTFSHPVANLMVSSLLYQLGLSTTGEGRREWAGKQIDYFKKGIVGYHSLPEDFTSDEETRTFVVAAAASAAIAYSWLGDSAGAASAVAEAQEVSPGNSFCRGIITDVTKFFKSVVGADRLTTDPPPVPVGTAIRDAQKRGEAKWERQLAETAV
jgi:hypothetical protein